MNNKILLLALIIITLVIGFYFINKPKENPTDTTKTSVNDTANPTSLTDQASQTSTIASEWQWQAVGDDNGNSQSNVENSLPFTPQTVHDALQAVKVDENGDVVLDHDALISLDEALERIYNQLDGESVLKLQDLIKNALPGKVGEQTSKLVGDYSNFLQAKEEFSQIHEGNAGAYVEPSVASVSSDQELYKELQALRELHLGRDATQRLFEQSDANAQFMFERMKLGLDDSLTPEQKEQRRAEIQARFDAIVGDPNAEQNDSQPID